MRTVKRTPEGVMLDSLLLWAFGALLTLVAFLAWAIIMVQNHYYFVTTPFSYFGIRVP
jgi:hypothetical protein